MLLYLSKKGYNSICHSIGFRKHDISFYWKAFDCEGNYLEQILLGVGVYILC